MKITPAIMVGGSGSRLWPVSTPETPKPFHALITEKSLLQETLLRTIGTHKEVTFTPPILIGAEQHLGLIQADLAGIDIEPQSIILEPSAQNTAAAAAVVTSLEASRADSDLTLLLPSDAFIANPTLFLNAISEAAHFAKAGSITTFGVAPTYAETGYGYILAGEHLGGHVHHIDAFKEKPDKQTAESYISDAKYSWNAGIFLYSPTTMLEAYVEHAADILDIAQKSIKAGKTNGNILALNETEYAKIRKTPIDCAIMENTRSGAVYNGLSCGWSDVGNWATLADLSPASNPSNVFSIDTANCFIRADEDSLIAAIGIENLVVIAHKGNILIAPKERAQDLKTLLAKMEETGNKMTNTESQ